MESKKARFGVRVTCAGPLSGVDALRRSSMEADRLGFDTLWVHDYFVWNQLLDSVHISCGSRETYWEASARDDYQPLFLESLTNLAYVAGITENIRLGLAVLCLPYREALGTAKQIANIDVLSNGRLELGIGQGAPLSTHNVEFEVMGISRGTKVRHTREVFEAMREVWTKDKATWHSEFCNFDEAEVYPKPVQKPHPPIWIGGSAEKSLEMIADYADGWLSFWITPDEFPPAIADIHRRMRERGRDPEKFTVGTEIQVYLADTMEQARAEAEPTMLAFEEGYAGTTGIHISAQDRTDTLEAIWASSLIGSPDDVAAQIHDFIESGCTAFEMKFMYHSVDHLVEQWTRFQEAVAPNFA